MQQDSWCQIQHKYGALPGGWRGQWPGTADEAWHQRRRDGEGGDRCWTPPSRAPTLHFDSTQNLYTNTEQSFPVRLCGEWFIILLDFNRQRSGRDTKTFHYGLCRKILNIIAVISTDLSILFSWISTDNDMVLTAHPLRQAVANYFKYRQLPDTAMDFHSCNRLFNGGSYCIGIDFIFRASQVIICNAHVM